MVFDPFDWNAFVDWMYQRFSVADSIFQMYGMLCDAVVVEPDGSRAEGLEDLPLSRARERDFGDKHVLLLTLEFGIADQEPQVYLRFSRAVPRVRRERTPHPDAPGGLPPPPRWR